MKHPRVKLVCIASNEAYFLPEWVYHHFYFGFDAIDVYINRTIDNSLAILDRLKLYFPSLSIYNFDWLDILDTEKSSVRIQSAAYMFAYQNACTNFDYVAFFDIDEFWMPINGKDTIQDCILKLQSPNVILFEMLHTGGQQTYAMPMMSCRFFEFIQPQATKFVIKTGLKPAQVATHTPQLINIDQYVNADGTAVVPNSDPALPVQFIDKNSIGPLKNFFIIHAFVRDAISLIAKLANGDCLRAKSFDHPDRVYASRFSYWRLYESSPSANFNNPIPSEYYHGFVKLFADPDLPFMLAKAKSFILYRALQALRLFRIYKDHPTARKLKDKFGSLAEMGKRIFDSLIALGELPPSVCYPDEPPVPSRLISPNGVEQTVANYANAMKLYPFVKDSKLEPLFLKSLVVWLCEQGEFDKASAILDDATLLTVRVFGKDWATPIFAKYYEQSGDRLNALKYYKRMLYSRDLDVIKKIEKLKGEK